MSKQASFYETVKDGIKCRLCPHQCFIREGKQGICRVRKNVSGDLIAESWGKVTAMHMDPIEKKPLYHFFPGRYILSLGGAGCSMRCQCCQNWQISQTGVAEITMGNVVSPEEILQIALNEKDNLGIAYTYNEPTVWFEFVLETAQRMQATGYKNVMVSNGFINPAPLDTLLPYIDAFNVDLKGFTENFYRRFTGSSLGPVLQSLKQIRRSGSHLELTCLIVPGQNDDPGIFREMVKWITNELGNETVLHLSRYHPAYKTSMEPTPAGVMKKLLEIASMELKYVYAGNISLDDFQDTVCSHCGHVVIRRSGYYTSITGLTDNGLCKICNKQIVMM